MTRVFTAAIVIICVLFVFSGCAATQAPTTRETQTGIGTLISRAEYVDTDNRHIPAEFNPKEVVLVFPYIPGQIFGNPTGEPLFVAHVKEDLAFELDLAGKIAEIDNGAKRLQASRLTEGLEVTPKSTRFARLGTFALDPKTGEPLGGGGFIDATSRDFLILLYVDRPCTISGTLELGEERHEHDIELGSPGFHWVRVYRVSTHHYRLNAFTPQTPPLFSISLIDLQQV